MPATTGKGYLEFDRFAEYITCTPTYQQIEKEATIVHIWPTDKLKTELYIDEFSKVEDFSKFYVDWSSLTRSHGYHYIGDNGDCSVTLYCVRYPMPFSSNTEKLDVKTIPMHTFVFDNQTKVDRFKYLVSAEYLQVRKEEDVVARQKQIEEFCAAIPDLANELYIITQQYFKELLGSDLVDQLDMPKFVQSAQSNLFELVYKHGQRDVTIPDDWANYIEREEEERDDVFNDFWCEVNYDMFYEYYPLFKKFSALMYELSKDEGPNGDCVSGSDIEALNLKYHVMVFKLAHNKFLP